MAAATDQAQAVQKLRELMKDIYFCMLTTIDDDDNLRSRPMSTNGNIEEDGSLWFFTYGSDHKVVEIERQNRVNVSFAAPDKQQYVSLSGTAALETDRDKIKELWQPDLKAWFPQGLDEPDIALLKISVEKAEYWDAPAGWVAKAIGFATAVTTGEKANPAEHEKIDLR
ncbi:pyridoxamine 5'-phosphate oxidase family protein [Leptolyngbya sp. FACHB-321]|uniref:pyridoxamine 5'-phosphate oxidase family protein n=1 Tax=Leptolyngbya sp. FACHB-321 TaxID=2692807 RepID=UPI001688E52A|nr:pyridoxamine 5'-phosphate oxidase family protein [Leptolyngbya sp. FACHB-321]MBD2038970.1 pyridoxamine 5'-phosphate oxidase family protein [Leptolyngbya sp. FACHB-321]